MKHVGTIVAASTVALMGSLLLARVHPFGNAGLYETKVARQPLMENSTTSPQVRAILTTKCADCHSMQTRPPLYGRFAPVSWLMERDILEGRRQMNLSLWDTFSADQQQAFKAKIVQQTREHQMPLLQYRILHWNARITDFDVQTLSLWARGAPIFEPTSTPGVIVAGDPIKGKAVFEKRCIGCHSMERNMEGPRLRGVFGRTSGEVAGFKYSAALKKANIQWDDSTLERWLADPDTLVPDNDMQFGVARPEERRDLIAFLKQDATK
jgi:cytochrome c